jgi:hypothetical protein
MVHCVEEYGYGCHWESSGQRGGYYNFPMFRNLSKYISSSGLNERKVIIMPSPGSSLCSFHKLSPFLQPLSPPDSYDARLFVDRLTEELRTELAKLAKKGKLEKKLRRMLRERGWKPFSEQ